MRSILLLLALIAPLAASEAAPAGSVPRPLSANLVAVESTQAPGQAATTAAIAPKRLAQQQGTPGKAWAYLGVIAGCSIVISLLVAGLIKLVAVTMNRSKKA